MADPTAMVRWLRRRPRKLNLLILGTAQGKQTFTDARMDPELRQEMRRSFRRAANGRSSEQANA